MMVTKGRQRRNPVSKDYKIAEPGRRPRRRRLPIFLESLEDRTLLSGIYSAIAAASTPRQPAP